MNRSWHRRRNRPALMLGITSSRSRTWWILSWRKSLRDPLTFPFFVWTRGRKQMKEQRMSHIPVKRMLERRHDVIVCNGDEGEKNNFKNVFMLFCSPKVYHCTETRWILKIMNQVWIIFYVNLVSSPHCKNTGFYTSFDLHNLRPKKTFFFF